MVNPYEDDHSPIDPDEGRYSPCGCGDPRCQIDGNDATNVRVGQQWFTADCVGLCYFCSTVDDLQHLRRIAGSWLAHPACAAKHDTVNEVRR